MKGGEFFKNPLGWKPNNVVDQDAKCKKDRRCVGWWWCFLLCRLGVFFMLFVVG